MLIHNKIILNHVILMSILIIKINYFNENF